MAPFVFSPSCGAEEGHVAVLLVRDLWPAHRKGMRVADLFRLAILLAAPLVLAILAAPLGRPLAGDADLATWTRAATAGAQRGCTVMYAMYIYWPFPLPYPPAVFG